MIAAGHPFSRPERWQSIGPPARISSSWLRSMLSSRMILMSSAATCAHAREVARPQRLFQRRETERERIEVAHGSVGVGPEVVGVGADRPGNSSGKQRPHLRLIAREVAAKLDLEIAETCLTYAELRFESLRRRVAEDGRVTKAARERRQVEQRLDRLAPPFRSGRAAPIRRPPRQRGERQFRRDGPRPIGQRGDVADRRLQVGWCEATNASAVATHSPVTYSRGHPSPTPTASSSPRRSPRSIAWPLDSPTHGRTPS